MWCHNGTSSSLYFTQSYQSLSPGDIFKKKNPLNTLFNKTFHTSFLFQWNRTQGDSRRMALHGKVPSVYSWGLRQKLRSRAGHDLSTDQSHPTESNPGSHSYIFNTVKIFVLYILYCSFIHSFISIYSFSCIFNIKIDLLPYSIKSNLLSNIKLHYYYYIRILKMSMIN